MNKKALRADILLLLTSIIWGFAFVAQRSGMEFVGPFTYNGIRFAIGSLSLLPLIAVRGAARRRGTIRTGGGSQAGPGRKSYILWTLAAGAALFLASSLQQVGIMTTTAGKAGFITGLYVVLVPILGIFLGQKTDGATWAGAVIAVAGLYLLSVAGNMGSINTGDILVASCALFFAVHVLLIDRLSKLLDPIILAAGQFAWCALGSLAAALFRETLDFQAILSAALPILYGGIGSVGIAYTLQVVAQKDAPPAHSAIILCLEGAFAAVGGILILHEPISLRGLLGSGLMLCGMLATQWSVITGGLRQRRSVP
jgi:drug/metabolite transporter (DMT)-like permease